MSSKTVEVSRTASNVACARRFVIGRERPGQQSEVAALIQQTLEQERRQRELLEQQYAHYDADDDEVMMGHDPLAAVSRFIDTHALVSRDGGRERRLESSLHVNQLPFPDS